MGGRPPAEGQNPVAVALKRAPVDTELGDRHIKKQGDRQKYTVVIRQGGRHGNPLTGNARCFGSFVRREQGTTEQNRTKQTNAQKQEKHTRTDKALSAEQAADFGMWQQSAAAPAR